MVRGVPTLCLILLMGSQSAMALAVASSATTSTGLNMQQLPQHTAPVCRGLGMREVDWWIMLKHPAGYLYSYLDSTFADGCTQGSCWRHRLTMLNPNPVGHTLALIGQAASAAISHQANFSDSADVAYVIYNDDDPPGMEHFDFAHAKGVVAFRSSSSSYQGFWLVHSAPRFPKDPAQPDFAELARAQSVFGQHFSCFSLSNKQSIAGVAQMLLTAGPYIYSSSLPVDLASEFPDWLRLVTGSSHEVPMSVSVSIRTAAGVPLHGFAKTKYLNASLTDAVVGPGLGSAMLWETWRRSHDALPSYCPGGESESLAEPFSSLNIQRIAFPDTPYTWPSLTDHSKWGLSGSDNVPQAALYMVCLGDMNRAWWQSQRGGGYVCTQHVGLWQAFSTIVAAVEPCIRPVST